MSRHWHHVAHGRGRPLVLLHGIGMSHEAWSPVLEPLARERRVIAVDLAGFGQSAALPQGVAPTQENLLEGLRQTLTALGVNEPVDLVGNSLGGQLALTAAREGLARTVVGLSPAGLWRGQRSPAHTRLILHAAHAALGRLPRLGEAAARVRLGRTLLFALPMTSQGWRLDPDEAVKVVRTFRGAAAFDATLAASTRFTGGERISVPLTVAFGTRDWLLTRSCQNREGLPAHTRWLQPRGWGHVPMWDDPAAVARLILESTA
ncbi:MAG: alpha/beta hydrolase fold [Panacagrimonas sp.]|jgi:pimeloyl-ACP methyl ester carboxylesterase|nr:alpha/beta hydrolase [Panacagrimonas sp.]MCC2657106.1 alpha/beta hydrolase fold [Panacagrimonas sp.]